MADIILFHHVQGLTEGVRAFADELRAAGNDVTAPDLYEGSIFETIEDGMAHAEGLGFVNILDAGVAIAEEHPPEVCYAGFSLGALIAHKLAQTRPGALGALLYHHGDVPVTTFGPSWPPGVDLQIHVSERDEFYEPEVVNEFIEAAKATANAEMFLYPGSTHLFTDSSLGEFDAESTAKVLHRTLDFLSSRS